MDRVAPPNVHTFHEFVSLIAHPETVIDWLDAHAAMRRVLIAEHAGSENDIAFERLHSALFRDPHQDADMSQLFRRTYSNLSRTHDLQRVRRQLAAVTRDRDLTLADLNSLLERTPASTRTHISSEYDDTCAAQTSTLRAALMRLNTTVDLLTDLESDHEQNVRDVALLGDYRYTMTAPHAVEPAIIKATGEDLTPYNSASASSDTPAQPPFAHAPPSPPFSLDFNTTRPRFRSSSPDLADDASSPAQRPPHSSVRSRHSPPAQVDPVIAHRLADRRLELSQEHAQLASHLHPLHDRIVALTEKEYEMRGRLRSQLSAEALEAQIQPLIQERNIVVMEHGGHNIRAFVIRQQLANLVRPTTPPQVACPRIPTSTAPLATSSSNSPQRTPHPSLSPMPHLPRRSLRLKKLRGPPA